MVAAFVAKRLRPIVLGQDPIAHEKLWDQMHRIMVHGRQGDAMLAISAIDCALWDLKGRWLGQPVFRLLGGPTRDSVPAYASMLGFAVLDLGRVRERAAEYQALGYPAQKWFFRHGPMSGHDGMRKNVDLVRTLRETLGDDYDIMLDCWQAFDPIYAVELAERIAEYRPRWLEECVMPDRIDTPSARVGEASRPSRHRRSAPPGSRGTTVAFVHPKTAFGTLIELVQDNMIGPRSGAELHAACRFPSRPTLEGPARRRRSAGQSRAVVAAAVAPEAASRACSA